jgi:Arc/MetJ-type ribon-helix-helix transcriptional regulator
MTETVEMAKQRLQVTVREDLVKWMDQQIEKARFGSRSHAIEYALTQLKENKKA